MHSVPDVPEVIDRSLAVGLLIACPATNGNPSDCPLHHVRLMPLRDRYEWFRSQSPEVISNIVCLHSGCPKMAASAKPPALVVSDSVADYVRRSAEAVRAP